MDKPSFISLYCGCGGIDAGFIESGYKCLRAFDINQKAVEVHNQNNFGSAITLDLLNASKSDLLERGKPDVVLAGSPCQGFSTAGKRELDDPRNTLLSHAGDLAVAVKPKVFIAENVTGVLAGKHKKYWEELESKLRAFGYSTKTILLDALKLGLPQRRRRVILIAWQGNANPKFEYNCPTTTTLRDVLSNIESLPQHDRIFLEEGSKHHLIAQKIKKGNKLCNVRGGPNSVHTWDIPEVFGVTTDEEKSILESTMFLRRKERLRNWGDADPVSFDSLIRDHGPNAPEFVNRLISKKFMRKIGARVDLVNTFNGKYRRLDWDSISLTVDTRFGDPRYFLHPDDNRGFTVREAARLQGFSDNFIFSGNSKEDYKMIGNAVPPPMGKFIADRIKHLARY